MLALVTFNARGSVTEMDQFAQRRFEPPRAERVLYLRKTLARIRGDLAEAMRLDREMPFYSGGPPLWTQKIAAAVTLENAGDLAGAQTLVRSVIEGMKAQAIRQPANSWLQSWLGQAYAMLCDR